jgi:hypothetical protein
VRARRKKLAGDLGAVARRGGRRRKGERGADARARPGRERKGERRERARGSGWRTGQAGPARPKREGERGGVLGLGFGLFSLLLLFLFFFYTLSIQTNLVEFK